MRAYAARPEVSGNNSRYLAIGGVCVDLYE